MRQSEQLRKPAERGITRLAAMKMVTKVTDLTRDMLAATAGFINAVNGFNGDIPTEITRPDINRVIRALRNNNAYTIMDMIEGEDRFGTGPIRASYFSLGSTQLVGDLDNVQGFLAAEQYPNQNPVLRSEYGSVSNIRFLMSSIGSFTPNASSLGANVYNNFVCGMEAKLIGLVKSLLIDLEALRGDRAQVAIATA